MDFKHARSKQPEIIRAVQKDVTYTNILTEELLDLLRLFSLQRWMKYCNKCKCLAEILYHSFASVNNLQTLGEEYTGIIQISRNFTSIPSKHALLSSIMLEFAAELLINHSLQMLGDNIADKQIDPQTRYRVSVLFSYLRKTTSILKAFHKAVFYIYADKYQIAKRLLGINYVTVRHWVKMDQPLYGYHVLGWISLFHIFVSVLVNYCETCDSNIFKTKVPSKGLGYEKSRLCALCQISRVNLSSTTCGHLFCWVCIAQWLNESNECPICRENIRKSNVIQLKNYM